MRNYLLLLLMCTGWMHAQVQPYQLYTQKGKKITFEKMAQELAKTDVVLFGEFHDNAIAHWMQLKLAQNLASKKPLTLGAEMFETDQADLLSAYVSGTLEAKAFDSLVRFWNNYPTDYQPLVEFAKTHKKPFVATNVPRKYASMLYTQGEEALLQLPQDEKQWIAPLPFPYDASLPGYAKMMEMFADQDHANANFPKAQAIKDATMAYQIVKHSQKGGLFLHFNGSYHSDFFEGIYWYISQYNPQLKVNTISTVSQENVHQLLKENKGKAHYILVVDQQMTKTFR